LSICNAEFLYKKWGTRYLGVNLLLKIQIGKSRVNLFYPNPSANLAGVEREVGNINKLMYVKTHELWKPSIAFFILFFHDNKGTKNKRGGM